MKILCVDDEQLLLRSLVRKIQSIEYVEEVEGFDTGADALEWLQTNKPDIAFLDIQLRQMTGLELAEQIHAIYPDTAVVFCTGYQEYTMDAFQLHATGYILKPVGTEALKKEIDHIRKLRQFFAKEKEDNKKYLLQVRCFGNFEAYASDKILIMKRKKTKELLAYLIDRRGSMVSSAEICAVLWPEQVNDGSNMHYLRQLISDLREALKKAGAEKVLISQQRIGYSLDTSLIECDYYKYLRGDENAIRSFQGEYMCQYDWAEITTANIK